jgi:hypothetical protein
MIWVIGFLHLFSVVVSCGYLLALEVEDSSPDPLGDRDGDGISEHAATDASRKASSPASRESLEGLGLPGIEQT